MICLLSFSILFLLPTAANAVPLRFFLAGAGFLLHCLILVVVGLTVSHFAEGRRGVKFNLSFEASFKSNEVCWSGGAVLSRCIQKASRKYETLGTDGNFSGEEIQNRGTFIVVRSSVFAVSSVQVTHLARDTCNAYSRWTGRRQGPFIQWSAERRKDRMLFRKTRSWNLLRDVHSFNVDRVRML